MLAVRGGGGPSRRGLLALATLLALEGGIVGGYWIIMHPRFPSFQQMSGKILSAGVVLGCAALGCWLGIAIARRLSVTRWAQLAGSWVGPVGFALLLSIPAANAGAAVLLWPRSGASAVRVDTAPGERLDVFVILIDTLRRDHLGFYGYPRPTSPCIDHLLAQSWVFSNAYTPSTWTTPSVASLMTGLYPGSHGVLMEENRVPAQLQTVAEQFRSYGYETGGFIANQVLTTGNGFSQGFNRFYPPEPASWWHHRRTAFERIAQRLREANPVTFGWKLNQEIREWLEGTPDRPHFAYVQYIEPHSTYVPPKADREAVAPGVPPGPLRPPLFRNYREALREIDCNDWECMENPPTLTPEELVGMIANYDGEVHRVDAHVGELLELLDELGRLDRCHIVFCADHGEEFFDHQGWFHGNSVYEEMVGSPLAYRPPGGLPDAVRIDRPVAQLDFMRTLFALLEMEPTPFHQGVEIPELLGEQPPSGPAPVLSERPPHLYALRHGRWKLIRRGPRADPDWRLFDLSVDRGERVNLANVYPDSLRLLRGWLEGILAANARTTVEPGSINRNPEMLRSLRNLGYIQ